MEEILQLILLNETPQKITIQKIRSLSQEDWRRLYELGLRFGLLPVIYLRLSGMVSAGVPKEALKQFRDAYFINFNKNILLEKELKEILSHFKENNIPVIPLKGPALAMFIYRALDLRAASNDLDFLVKEEDIADAENTLLDLGFVSMQEREDGFVRRLKLKYARQLHFNKRVDGLGSLIVDLHFDLRGFFVETSLINFWGDARERDLGGYEALFPSNEQLLLYLSLTSLSTFEFVELKYLYDIHTLVLRLKDELDWVRFSRTLAKSNLRASVFFSLKFSKEIFRTGLPEEILMQLRPSFVKRRILGAWISRDRVFYQNRKTAESYTWRYLISSLLYSQDALDCISIIRQKVFIPMHEVMGMQHQPQGTISYVGYLGRLLKPLKRLIRS